MKLKLPIVLVAIVIAIFLTAVYLIFFQKRVVAPIGPTTFISPEPSASIVVENKSLPDEIFKAALNLYIEKKEAGTDFSKGPCLGKIADGWVLDIAHNPRNADDNKRENQCPLYLNGEAEHFVELDPEGNLIQAK